MDQPHKQTAERESKLRVEWGFTLQQLPGQPLPFRLFPSTYFDTEDYWLAHAGITLRGKLTAFAVDRLVERQFERRRRGRAELPHVRTKRLKRGHKAWR